VGDATRRQLELEEKTQQDEATRPARSLCGVVELQILQQRAPMDAKMWKDKGKEMAARAMATDKVHDRNHWRMFLERARASCGVKAWTIGRPCRQAKTCAPAWQDAG